MEQEFTIAKPKKYRCAKWHEFTSDGAVISFMLDGKYIVPPMCFVCYAEFVAANVSKAEEVEET